MNYADIKKLVKLVESSDINELEIEENDSKVRIQKRTAANENSILTHYQLPPQTYAPPPMDYASQLRPESGSPASKEAEEPVSKLVSVTSPMVGTFYRAPSPEAPAYVNVGDNIKMGQVLCIVEAMKLMNEIESEVSGRVVEIAIENAQAVEFDQLLFKIDPT